MKAISVRSPWWWFIVHGLKDVENRNWPTHFRGKVLIHASKWFNGTEVLQDMVEVRDTILDAPIGITLRLSDSPSELRTHCWKRRYRSLRSTA